MKTDWQPPRSWHGLGWGFSQGTLSTLDATSTSWVLLGAAGPQQLRILLLQGRASPSCWNILQSFLRFQIRASENWCLVQSLLYLLYCSWWLFSTPDVPPGRSTRHSNIRWSKACFVVEHSPSCMSSGRQVMTETASLNPPPKSFFEDWTWCLGRENPWKISE